MLPAVNEPNNKMEIFMELKKKKQEDRADLKKDQRASKN